jgi:hypothetical protein
MVSLFDVSMRAGTRRHVREVRRLRSGIPQRHRVQFAGQPLEDQASVQDLSAWIASASGQFGVCARFADEFAAIRRPSQRRAEGDG